MAGYVLMNEPPKNGTEPEAERDSNLPSVSGQELSSFNSAFDELVRENMARSQALLREAMELPAAADRAVQRARAGMQAQLDAERASQVVLFAEVRTELATGQAEVSALIAGFATVFSRFTALSDSLAPHVPSETETQSDREEPAAPTFADSDDSPTRDGTAFALEASRESVEPAGDTPGPLESGVVSEREEDYVPSSAPDDERDLQSEDVAEFNSPELSGEPQDEHTITLLVRGARRLRLVIQLQRHLTAFSEIERVRLRDFVSGVVRFEITSFRPIAEADVTAWCGDDATPLEVVTLSNSEIELRFLDVVFSRQ